MSHFLFVLLVLNHLGMCDQHQIVVFHQSCSFSGRRDVSRIIETLFRFPFTSHDHFTLPMIHHETLKNIFGRKTRSKQLGRYIFSLLRFFPLKLLAFAETSKYLRMDRPLSHL